MPAQKNPTHFEKIKHLIHQIFQIKKPPVLSDVTTSLPFFKPEGIAKEIEQSLHDSLTHVRPSYFTLGIRHSNISPEIFKQMVKELFSSEHVLTEARREKLEKMLMDIQKIDDAMAYFKKFNLTWGLDLVGGAVRDLLLDKEVKDLDVLVTLSTINKRDTDYFYREFLEHNDNKRDFSKEELDSVDFNDSDTISTKLSKLIALCLSKKQTIDEQFYFTDEARFTEGSYGPTLVEAISGMIKIKDKNNHYPMDILVVTDADREIFFDKMDLNICKVGLCLKDKEIDCLKDFPDINNIQTRLYAKVCFFEDVHHKRISMSIAEKTLEQLDYTCNVHMPRVEQKYNYPVVIEPMSDFDKTMYKTKIQATEIMLSHYYLNKNLPKKSSATKKVKI